MSLLIDLLPNTQSKIYVDRAPNLQRDGYDVGIDVSKVDSITVRVISRSTATTWFLSGDTSAAPSDKAALISHISTDETSARTVDVSGVNFVWLNVEDPTLPLQILIEGDVS